MIDLLKRRAAAKEEAAVAAVHAWEGKLDADAAAKEADRVLIAAYRAAVDAGWSESDLKAIGIKLPESARAKKVKPSRSEKPGNGRGRPSFKQRDDDDDDVRPEQPESVSTHVPVSGDE